jgi:hypothetical protein
MLQECQVLRSLLIAVVVEAGVDDATVGIRK